MPELIPRHHWNGPDKVAEGMGFSKIEAVPEENKPG
jgi:hypothetical protein